MAVTLHKETSMTTTVNFQELECCLAAGQFMDYKLCYIDDHAKTYWDYTPEAKAYSETEEGGSSKSNKEAVAILAGCKPAESMEKVRQIQEAVRPWNRKMRTQSDAIASRMLALTSAQSSSSNISGMGSGSASSK